MLLFTLELYFLFGQPLQLVFIFTGRLSYFFEAAVQGMPVKVTPFPFFSIHTDTERIYKTDRVQGWRR